MEPFKSIQISKPNTKNIMYSWSLVHYIYYRSQEEVSTGITLGKLLWLTSYDMDYNSKIFYIKSELWQTINECGMYPLVEMTCEVINYSVVIDQQMLL